jgi:hypothetical protein
MIKIKIGSKKPIKQMKEILDPNEFQDWERHYVHIDPEHLNRMKTNDYADMFKDQPNRFVEEPMNSNIQNIVHGVIMVNDFEPLTLKQCYELGAKDKDIYDKGDPFDEKRPYYQDFTLYDVHKKISDSPLEVVKYAERFKDVNRKVIVAFEGHREIEDGKMGHIELIYFSINDEAFRCEVNNIWKYYA